MAWFYAAEWPTFAPPLTRAWHAAAQAVSLPCEPYRTQVSPILEHQIRLEQRRNDGKPLNCGLRAMYRKGPSVPFAGPSISWLAPIVWHPERAAS